MNQSINEKAGRNRISKEDEYSVAKEPWEEGKALRLSLTKVNKKLMPGSSKGEGKGTFRSAGGDIQEFLEKFPAAIEGGRWVYSLQGGERSFFRSQRDQGSL